MDLDSLRPSKPELSQRNRLIAYYLLGLASVVLLYSVLYNYGMLVFEGRDHPLARSFQTVVETMTTTGYGADSPWDTTVMNAFVVFMQLTGIGIGFFTLRVIIIPLFTGAEVDLDRRLSPKRDHVIICEYSRDSTVLLEELREIGMEYVLLASEKDAAKDLSDAGYAAIHGSPQDRSALERAGIENARAVITDAGDANVDTILTVRSIREDIDVVVLTDDSDKRPLLLDAGADTVLSPRGVLGHRLAEKAVTSSNWGLGETVDLGADIEVTEIPVDQESELVGTRIRNSKIRERTGVNIVGAWIDGELQLPPDPDAIVQPNTVLVVSGGHTDLEKLSEFTRAPRRPSAHERVIIAGFGEVGQAAQSVIEDAEIESVTVDVEDREGVDVVGDATSRDVLRETGIENAGAIIVGLPDDSRALLTTVTARSLSTTVEVLVRVHDTDATQKALSGGADYVLSVPRISARMVAMELLGEDVLAPASQVRLLRVPARPFAGMTLAGSGIYEKTGCRIIAIEDKDGITSTLDPRRKFDGDEKLVIVGSDEGVQQFLRRFDVSVTEEIA